MHKYRNQVLNVLLLLLVLFSIIALYAFVHLQRKTAILNIGLDYFQENVIIIVLAILSMIKVIYEIYRIEHPSKYERRVIKQVKEKHL